MTEPSMEIRITVPEIGTTSMHTKAHNVPDALVVPLLRKAIATIEAEIVGYENCPAHKAAVARQAPPDDAVREHAMEIWGALRDLMWCGRHDTSSTAMARANAVYLKVAAARGHADPDTEAARASVQIAGGGQVTDDHREINPATGQQKGYVVLSPEERAKGVVRPVRRSYVHVGRKVCGKRPQDGGTLVCSMEPDHTGPCLVFAEAVGVLGRLDAASRIGGCGALTIMSQDIAETFARNPAFYSGTFCSRCRTHRPLAEFVWDGTEETVGS